MLPDVRCCRRCEFVVGFGLDARSHQSLRRPVGLRLVVDESANLRVVVVEQIGAQKCWGAGDIGSNEEVGPFLAGALLEYRRQLPAQPRAVYQNVGMPAFTGPDAIVENMAGQFSMFPETYAFEIVKLASDGPVVLTECLDYIRAPDGSKPAIPVMGTFVVDDDGKITRWTDYFDLNLIMKLLQGEDISGLVPATG